jgi:RNA polymerase sigma factor (sigma-70 family)
MPPDPVPAHSRSSSVFVTTSWQDLRLFRQEGSDAEAARERFCKRYWRPLYVYLRVFLRRRGGDEGAAEDLVQEFFEYVLRKPRLPEEPRGEGRFRSFLIRALENFLKDQWKSAGRQKRRPAGGWVSLEAEELGAGFEAEFAGYDSPEQALGRAWALQLLARAIDRAKEEFLATGRSDLWAAIESRLQGADGEEPYADLARRLGMTQGAFKTAVHRGRERFRQSIRCEVARTLGWQGTDARDLESDLRHDARLRQEHADEMAHLLAAVS